MSLIINRFVCLLQPPILPDVHHDGDTTNFDDYPETDWKPTTAIDQKDLQLFNDF